MATQRKQKQKHLPKRIGNPLRKVRRDRSFAALPDRKLRRILARNGEAAAVEWAKAHAASGVLNRLLREIAGR